MFHIKKFDIVRSAQSHNYFGHCFYVVTVKNNSSFNDYLVTDILSDTQKSVNAIPSPTTVLSWSAKNEMREQKRCANFKRGLRMLFQKRGNGVKVLVQIMTQTIRNRPISIELINWNNCRNTSSVNTVFDRKNGLIIWKQTCMFVSLSLRSPYMKQVPWHSDNIFLRIVFWSMSIQINQIKYNRTFQICRKYVINKALCLTTRTIIEKIQFPFHYIHSIVVILYLYANA